MWYSALVKKKSFLLSLILPLAVTLLSGCTIYDLFGVSDSKPGTSTQEGNYRTDFDPNGIGYYRAKGDKKMTPFTYRDINYSGGMDNIVSNGDAKLLCVPIEFTDYPFYGNSKSPYRSEEEMMSDFDIAFNGESEDTGYWESLSSFYEKSSYGKFGLHVDFADIYKTGETVSEFRSKDASSLKEAGHIIETLEKVVEGLRSSKGNDYLKQYDTDKDGWIDGIIMIYSCPDFRSDSSIQRIDASGSTFWAFCYWAAEDYGKVSAPTSNLFFWASNSFFHEVAKKPRVDCHTIIHEFGHMLGLDDYYPAPGSSWNAAGGLMMMDENILDHDLFSKTALGWTEPYVVNGKKDLALTISPSQLNGDCIVIPASNSWNQTAFSEYLILDLYTPSGLNSLDSTRAYSSRTLGYDVPGIRMFHVDARLKAYQMNTATKKAEWVYYYKDSLPSNATFQVAATNCYKDSSRCDENYSLLAMVDADNTKNFRRGAVADNDSLFQTGDTFSFTKYRAYFPNGEKWNDGSSSSVTITFSEVKADSATINFTF